ncbi:MAG: hypothetical protein WKF86_00690 [Acidimicrobiales bacterium]
MASVGMASAAVLAGTSAGWACVPQPLLTLTPVASGPEGTEVIVNAYSVSGRAEIRWNAIDGPMLGTGQGPVFSVPLKVPSSAPGLYTVLLLERGPGGALGSTGRAAFQVTGGTQPAPGPFTTATHAPSPRSSSVTASKVLAGAGLLAVGAIGGAIVVRRRPNRTSN